jgi:hypothetical protein
MPTETMLGYHSPTIAAATRFMNEGALDGSEYFIGKPVSVMHAALRGEATEPVSETSAVSDTPQSINQKAPWTPAQVSKLNQYQQAGRYHEFTCPEPHPEGRHLVATTRGWICPHCDYTQDWAHAFMFLDVPRAAETFQARCMEWMLKCFTPEITADRLERGDRLLEEVLELLQSGHYPPERVQSLLSYVYARSVGEPSQEVGGVMVTLAAYCGAHDLDMADAGEAELERILQPDIIEKIRAKQASKPTGSALPIATSGYMQVPLEPSPIKSPHGDAIGIDGGVRG